MQRPSTISSTRPSPLPGHPPLEAWLEWLWREHADEVESVILFGSRARGDALDVSDYDVLLVVREDDGLRFTDRIGIFQDVETGKVEVFPYTPGDMVGMEADRHGFLLEALADGRALFDRGTWAALKARFDRQVVDGRISRKAGVWELR